MIYEINDNDDNQWTGRVRNEQGFEVCFFLLSSYVHELFQTQNSSVMSSSWPQHRSYTEPSLELYIILWHQRQVRDLMEGTGE